MEKAPKDIGDDHSFEFSVTIRWISAGVNDLLSLARSKIVAIISLMSSCGRTEGRPGNSMKFRSAAYFFALSRMVHRSTLNGLLMRTDGTGRRVPSAERDRGNNFTCK